MWSDAVIRLTGVDRLWCRSARNCSIEQPLGKTNVLDHPQKCEILVKFDAIVIGIIPYTVNCIRTLL